MATTADAEVLLKLYELRQEEGLRTARKFLGADFNPKTIEELRAVSRGAGTQENAYWRQATSYWEMAHSLVLRGAIDADLFLDSAAEGLFLYAKFHHWHAETEKATGNPFMRNTAKLIETNATARKRYEAALANMEASRAASK
jgi:hypothetical protein